MIVEVSSDLIQFVQTTAAACGFGASAFSALFLFGSRTNHTTDSFANEFALAQRVGTGALATTWVCLLAAVILTAGIDPSNKVGVLSSLLLTASILTLAMGPVARRVQDCLAAHPEQSIKDLSPEALIWAVAGTAGPCAAWLTTLALYTVTLLSTVPAIILLLAVALGQIALVWTAIRLVQDQFRTPKEAEATWQPPAFTKEMMIASVLKVEPRGSSANLAPKKVAIPLMPLGAVRPKTILTK